jgi:N-carbamoyl-L-amino-acid hydrolase
MAGLCPSGMIFIPCKNGRSHCPEEWVNQEQIAAGTITLLDAIKIYDKQNL